MKNKITLILLLCSVSVYASDNNDCEEFLKIGDYFLEKTQNKMNTPSIIANSLVAQAHYKRYEICIKIKTIK